MFQSKNNILLNFIDSILFFIDNATEKISLKKQNKKMCKTFENFLKQLLLINPKPISKYKNINKYLIKKNKKQKINFINKIKILQSDNLRLENDNLRLETDLKNLNDKISKKSFASNNFLTLVAIYDTKAHNDDDNCTNQKEK